MARPEIKTIQNLESAFAGESMAHIKYRYFAKLARAAGDEETAKIFEATAEQEVMHAFGHLDLLYPADTITPARALEIAIAGETYEYTEMYPSFRKTAVEEGNTAAIHEIDEQIAESKEHAEQFQACKKADIRKDEGMEATSLLTLLQMVESGFGIALLPEMAVKSSLLNNSDLVAKAMAAPAPKRVIALVARSSTAHQAEFAALSDCIRERFGVNLKKP
jgi:rubrerythrin